MRQRWAQLVAAIAVLGALTACAGGSDSPESSGAGGGVGESRVADSSVAAAAPMPQNVPGQVPFEKRDVVKTATMRITVADSSKAADDAAVLVEDVGGRVDSRTEDAGSGTGRALTMIVLRVPVAELDGVVRDLKDLGTVEYAETTSEDVTAQRVDLDARIRALQTSVDRLLAIMNDARDPEALISAENALSQRQADLDSLRAQREALGDRVDYSTVNVTFTAERIGGPAPQQYQGFSGQIHRGWDGLISVIGSGVLLFGLALPWLAVLGVVAVLCYGLTRLLGGRQRSPVAAAKDATNNADSNGADKNDEEPAAVSDPETRG
ncbi:MAG: DUF4349 domain-containing protein [Mycobacterium sp.]